MSSNGVKAAATALIRMMRAGKLSAPSINRAAQAMDPGKFRFLRNLGRGQFNLADEVVGNVGGQAGRMVRKLPAHAYQTPQQGYQGLKAFVDKTNKQLPTTTGAPAIAPYMDVNQRGAFQSFADQAVHSEDAIQTMLRENNKARFANVDKPRPPLLMRWDAARNPTPGADQLLGDLHPGNVGPGGQIIDFTAPGIGWADDTASRVSTSPWKLVADNIPGGRDRLANLDSLTAAEQSLNSRINNGIRRFYDGLTPTQREIAMTDRVPVPQPAARNASDRLRAIQLHWQQRAALRDQAPPLRGMMQQRPLPPAQPPVQLPASQLPVQQPRERSPSMGRMIDDPWDHLLNFFGGSAKPAPPPQRIWPWLVAGGAAGGGGGLLAEYLRSQGKR